MVNKYGIVGDYIYIISGKRVQDTSNELIIKAGMHKIFRLRKY